MKSVATLVLPRCLVLRMVPCCLPSRRCIRSSPGTICAFSVAFVPRGASVDGTWWCSPVAVTLSSVHTRGDVDGEGDRDYAAVS